MSNNYFFKKCPKQGMLYPKFIFNSCLSLCLRVGGRITANVSRLCEVADFQHKCSFEKLNLNLAHNCQRSTEPAILQNRCQHFALLFCRVCSLSFRVCLGALAWWLFCKTWLQRWLVRFCKCATKCVGYIFNVSSNVFLNSFSFA